MSNNSKIQKIFSTPDIKHGLALFNREELKKDQVEASE